MDDCFRDSRRLYTALFASSILIFSLFSLFPFDIDTTGYPNGTLDGSLMESQVEEIHHTRSSPSAAVDITDGYRLYNYAGGGTLRFNITVEELRGINVTITGGYITLYSLDSAQVHMDRSIVIPDVKIRGGSTAKVEISVEIPPEIIPECARQGDDRARIRLDLICMDENGHTLTPYTYSEVSFRMKVAVLVARNVSYFIRDELDRYYLDIKEKNSVEFIEVIRSWETPGSVREDLISLWENESISGAILVGDIPFAMWEINHSDGSKEPCPIPIFYEDLDGGFADNDSNGYYDLHYWGENDGPEIWVSFLSPPSETIPSTNLRTPGPYPSPGLEGVYYSDNDFQNQVITRTDPQIEHYWREYDPPSPVPSDGFSIWWEGEVLAEAKSNYTLQLIHGGGVILEVDDQEVIRDEHCPPWNMRSDSMDIHLTEGWHDIDLWYKENGWGEHRGLVRLCWRSPEIVAGLIGDWFDKNHAYHTGEMDYPEKGLLFMDYCYGLQCKMMDPIRTTHIEPLFGEHLDAAGGENTTNATEYLQYLDMGHEITSIWSHAGGGGHQFQVDPDSGAEVTGAQSYLIKETKGSVATLIWGCHAGDFADSYYSLSASKTENLVINYAFNTEYGLAALGCTRSYGTTFDRVYHDWREGSYLGLGYFHFKDIGYDRDLRTAESHSLGEERWIEDEVMFGDPFIRVDHFPETPVLRIENGSRFASGEEVRLSISSEGATEMLIHSQGKYTDWIPFESEFSLLVNPINSTLEVMVWTRNGYGDSHFLARDLIFMENEAPTIDKFEINLGETITNNSTVMLRMAFSDNISGPSEMSFSDNGTAWSQWEEAVTEKIWTLDGGDGEKCVYLRLKDRAGNIATSVKTIVLDTAGPAVFSTIVGSLGSNGWYTSSTIVDLGSEETDVVGIFYRLDTADWTSYNSQLDIEGEGQHEMEFYSVDLAGNIGPLSNISFGIDSEPPFDVMVSTVDNIDRTNSLEIPLSIDGYDNTSGIGWVSFSSDGIYWDDWLEYRTTDYIYLLENGDGQKRVYGRLMDRAGNIGEAECPIEIYLDTEAPTIRGYHPDNGSVLDIDSTIELSFSENVDLTNIDILLSDDQGGKVNANITLFTDRLEIDPGLWGYLSFWTTISGTVSDRVENTRDIYLVLHYTVAGEPPGSPRGLTAVINSTWVELNWSPPERVGDLPIEGYRVERNGIGEDWITIGSTMDTNFIDTNVTELSSYQYRIVPFNDVEEGEASNVVLITVAFLHNGGENAAEEDDERPFNNLVVMIVIAICSIAASLVLLFLLMRWRHEPYEE